MTKARLTICLAGLLMGASVLVAPGTLRAELYVYTDSQGVTHFTNIKRTLPAGVNPKTTKGTRTTKTPKKKNTYNWKDKRGILQKVHKVGIKTYDPIIIEAAQYYSLPPSLVKAVIATESSFNPTVTSHAGAQGLMQLMPATAREMQINNVFDPRQNIFGGTRYLRVMANRFDGSIRLTLAAYNAGPTAVKRAGGVPPYKETQKYVKRVLHLYHHYLSHQDPST
jgi:soluble lytic murein transglycosylase-like protein